MKIPLAIIALLAAAGVYGQTTPAEDPMDADISGQLRQVPSMNLSLTQPQKPNEIKGDRVTYSGILVELTKTDNPVQLINPAAPEEYGSSEDNTARDPVSGEVSGLKLFSIQF